MAAVVALGLWTGGPDTRPIAQSVEPQIAAMQAPLYPGVALYLGISGTVVADVEVDGSGTAKVVIVSSTSKWLTAPTLTNLKTWRFETGFPASFRVAFHYVIKGDPAPPPDNPHVALDLPTGVTVTARPIKPTVVY